MGKLSFRQIHLDFHTSEKIEEVGKKFDGEKFAATLKKAGVESINLFSRCHHGRLYYNTELKAYHPGLKRDLLREQVEACHKYGIKTPLYITVGWDEYAAKNHPEWIERKPDGRAYGTATTEGTGEPLLPGWKTLCLNTPYVDYVEEQTIDLLNKFGDLVDGLWFDIVWQDPCCCTHCMDGMEKEGFDPEKEEDRITYAKQIENNFKKRMTKTVRKYNKDCLLFFNEGHIGPSIREVLDCYSHIEIESLGSGEWGYEHFPITVRYAKNLGKEYIAMTGRFHKSWADFGGYKNAEAMEYECFSAIAHGAKCSIGDQLHPTGEINEATYELIGGVFNKIAKKEPWCDDVVAISEIGVFTPQALEGGGKQLPPSLSGVYRMLEEGHYQFDIIDDKMDFNKYKVMILPDIITLNKDLKSKIDNYIAQGGRILLSYKSGLGSDGKEFVIKDLDLKLIGESEYSPDYVMVGDKIKTGVFNTEYVMYDKGLYVESTNSEKLARIVNPYFNRTYKHFCSHCHTPADKESEYASVLKHNNIIYFSHPIFTMYHKHGMKAYKQMVLNSLNILLENKMVETDAPTTAHINMNYQFKEDRYVVHILHYIPERRCLDLDTIEDVIPLYNVHLKVKLRRQPKRVYCAPSMEELNFKYEEDYVNVTVPEVIGHNMIVFE